MGDYYGSEKVFGGGDDDRRMYGVFLCLRKPAGRYAAENPGRGDIL